MNAARASLGRLQNRVAIVTGASNGIGRAIALAFAREGSSVVCADIRESVDNNHQCTQDMIRETGSRSIFVKTDVGDSTSMKTLVDTTVQEFGRVDIMVNNAGIAPEASNPLPISETPDDIFDSTMRINSKGVWLGCKYAGQQMIKQSVQGRDSRGWIVNISSVLGLAGKGGTSAYAASKGSVISLTRAVAMDYAPYNIHCNVICPGFTRTTMIQQMCDVDNTREALNVAHPLKGLGHPDDIAKVAIFLASDDANWVTAVTLPVDGGYVAQ